MIQVKHFFNLMVYGLQPIGIVAVTYLLEFLNLYDILIFIQGTLFSFLMMEMLISFSHQYLWHGPLWFLHKIHHQNPNNEYLDNNDILGLGNALWIMSLIFLWYKNPDSKYYLLFGSYFIGLITYGALVLYLHDGLSHKRFNTIWLPCKKKLRYQASLHLRHHKTKENDIIGVSPYGFFLASFELKYRLQYNVCFVLLIISELYLFSLL